jgi:hypothetical protein
MYSERDYASSSPDSNSELAARVIECLMQTAEMQWVSEQLRLQSTEDLTYSESGDEPIRHQAGVASGSNTYVPGEVSGDDDEDEPSHPHRHPMRLRESKNEADEFQQAVEDEQDASGLEEREKGYSRRLRHSKEHQHFKQYKPGVGGKSIYEEGKFIHRHEQDQPADGPALEIRGEKISDLLKAGLIREAEVAALRQAHEQHQRRMKLFSSQVEGAFGGPKSNVAMSVRDHAEYSEPPSGFDVEMQDIEFKQKLFDMEKKSRAEYLASVERRKADGGTGDYDADVRMHAKRQRVRHQKKMRDQSQPYTPPGWMLAQTVVTSKDAALTMAKAALQQGANASNDVYERLVSQTAS